jgi:peptidoglycan/LPS O-acetylase OafA/YrhL
MTSMLCGLVCFSATARGILTLDISREYLAMHNIITKIDTFAIGIYIAHLYVHRKWNAPPWILIGVGVLVLHGGLVLLTLAQGEVISVRSSIISHFLVPSGWGMITLGCLRSKSKFVDVIVRNRFIVYIGLACFSVYVWHTPIIIAIKPHLNIYRFIESIILLTAVSTLSYTYIERSKR